jgi:indolepyruvate ferredoxin oxidoreductase, beta subunit
MTKIDFLMAGVGGQGTILASNILAEVGLTLGFDVKKAEVHGMAQRGGQVDSHVRWGENVRSPLVEDDSVDYLIGFEMLEAARFPHFLKKEGVALVNDYRINPPAVNLGKARYPSREEIETLLRQRAGQVLWVNGTGIAKDLGNPAMVGVVLLGALSKLVGGETEQWLGVIERMVPPKFADLNKEAFIAGRKSAG